MKQETTRLVQLQRNGIRRIAQVKEPELVLAGYYASVYDLVLDSLDRIVGLKDLIASSLTSVTLDYESVYTGKSEWKLLPSFDHPGEPLSCLVAGTGLTHKNSALNRQMMHVAGDDKPTDSMRMYQWGVDGGTPASGQIGVQPEWFYKGNGSVLRGHGEPLEVPAFANDGGEEPELAGVYIISKEGIPYRVGFTAGNEFSDHVMEKKNYLYLAPSKLRTCAIGPELVIDAGFEGFDGKVHIVRKGATVWESGISTGEANMAHSLSNLEYHHFKYPGHRIPLQSHVHFFGADAFSFGSGIHLQDGDEMHVAWDGLGRPLVNTVSIAQTPEVMVEIRPV